MKQYGFTKSDRILKHFEYLCLSKSSGTVRDRFFLVAFSQGTHERSRLGITVSKRVGNAVARNRLKRIIREFFRMNRDILNGHWDLNVIAKQGAADLTNQQAFRALTQLFGKITRKTDDGC